MWSDVLVSTDFQNGCPIVAAACSRDEAPDAAAAAADLFAQWAGLLAERLASDGIDPTVAQRLSVTVIAAVEGAVILSRATKSTDPLEQVSHNLEELIAMHRPRPRRDRSMSG